MMNILAVDPGKKGGAVLMDASGIIHSMLTSGDNEEEMRMFILAALSFCVQWNASVKAVIEFCQPFPGIAAKANFQVGVGYGFWRGLFVANHIGYESVRAQVWQTIITKKKGWSRVELKKELVAEAVRRWPDIGKLKKGEQSGVADAALLAEFTRTRGMT